MLNPIKDIKLLFTPYRRYKSLSIKFNNLVDSYASICQKISIRENELHRKETGFTENIKSLYSEIDDLKQKNFILKKQVDFLTVTIERGEISKAICSVKAATYHALKSGRPLSIIHYTPDH